MPQSVQHSCSPCDAEMKYRVLENSQLASVQHQAHCDNCTTPLSAEQQQTLRGISGSASKRDPHRHRCQLSLSCNASLLSEPYQYYKKMTHLLPTGSISTCFQEWTFWKALPYFQSQSVLTHRGLCVACSAHTSATAIAGTWHSAC
jgi:hypothetical protein